VHLLLGYNHKGYHAAVVCRAIRRLASCCCSHHSLDQMAESSEDFGELAVIGVIKEVIRDY
jgi:hypothetical protein